MKLQLLAAIFALALLGAACEQRGPGNEVGQHGGESTSTPPTATAGQPGGGVTPSAADWRPCAGDYLCTVLTVPLDYSGSTPGTIEFRVMRWPAADPGERIGALLIDPGGPGAPGTGFLQSLAVQSWSGLHRKFDIVGFDPRGVAGPGDSVDCVDNMDGYYDVANPVTDHEFAELLKISESFAAACERNSGRILPFLSAESVARDMDAIRVALGEEQISYLGFSYGTYLGAMYAELFPERVRAMVLDGAVDPELDAKQWQLQQAVGFETAFDAFAADCDSSSSCPLSSDGGAASAYDTLIASLRNNPLGVGARTLGHNQAEIAVVGALYSRRAWPSLANAIAYGLDGDGSMLLEMFDNFVGREPDGTYDNFTEVYRAISCVDLDFPRDPAEYQQWADEFAREAPRFGRGLAYEHIDCAFWPAPAVQIPAIDANGAPPIVVVGTTRDPATPLSWAVSLAHELEPGVLLEVDGDGHTAYGSNPCATNAVDDYLLLLDVPGDGTTCPAASP